MRYAAPVADAARGEKGNGTMEADKTAVAALAEVIAGEGDIVSARLPTPAEAAALGLEPWAGIPIIAIIRSSTGAEELFDARHVQVIAK